MGFVRLLLALSVVCEHARLPFDFVGGRLAVQLFFLMSGFVISHVLTKKAAYRDAGTFYAARALRIFPAYLLVAALMLALRLVEGERLAEFMTLPATAQAALILSNILIVGQDWIMFLAAADNGLAFTADFHQTSPQLWTFLLLPQAWTLSLELYFYALAPFIVPRRRLLWAILACSLAVRIGGLALGLTYDPWLYRFFPFEMAIFAAGALSHQLLLPIARRMKSSSTPLAAAVGLLAAQPLLHLPAPVMLGLFALIAPFLFLIESESDRLFGGLSYPLYLIHWPVLLVGLRMGETFGVPPLLVGSAVLVLSLIAGYGLFVLLQPFETLRHGLGRDRAERLPAAGSARRWLVD